MRKLFKQILNILPVSINLKLFSAALTLVNNTLFTRILNINSRRGPLFITWLVTYDCNAFCKYCSTHNLKKSFPENLSPERSIEIAHEIGKAKTWVVGFSGGEALMWPHLFEVIKVLKSYDVVTYIATNGWLLEESADKIIENNVDFIFVSIDSDKPEEHDLMRGKEGLHQKLLKGIEALKRKRKGKTPTIKSGTILTRSSLPNLTRTIEKLAKIVDVVNIQPIVNGYENSPHNKSDMSLRNTFFSSSDEDFMRQEMDKLFKIYPEFNVPYLRLFTEYLFHKDVLINKIMCWSPFLRLQIAPNGDAFHCLANSKYSAVGNLKYTSLLEIWNSDKMMRQREEIRQHKNNCICWSQDASFNAFIDSLYFVNKLPVFKKKNL